MLTCSALEMNGIDEIWETVLRAPRRVFGRSGELEETRRQQAVAWMWSLVEEGLKERFARHPEVQKQLPRILREVERGSLRSHRCRRPSFFFLTTACNIEDIPNLYTSAQGAAGGRRAALNAAAVVAAHPAPLPRETTRNVHVYQERNEPWVLSMTKSRT